MFSLRFQPNATVVEVGPYPKGGYLQGIVAISIPSCYAILTFDGVGRVIMDSKMNEDVPAVLGEEIGGAGKTYFNDVVTDNILDALLELSAAVWTYHDRVIVLEKVLAEKGIEVSDAIEAHLPDEAEISEREAERAALVQRVFGSFVRRPTARPNPITPAVREGNGQ